MKLAVIVGHNVKAQGAQRVTDGRTEFDWNSDLAELISKVGPGVRIFTRTPGGGYSAEIDRVYEEVNRFDPDLYVELHFNAASALARGCETLSSGSNGSIIWCKALQAAQHQILGNPNRGVKILKHRDRGHRSLIAGRAPGAILEPYFGSSESDCRVADANMEALAHGIYAAAVNVTSD